MAFANHRNVIFTVHLVPSTPLLGALNDSVFRLERKTKIPNEQSQKSVESFTYLES